MIALVDQQSMRTETQRFYGKDGWWTDDVKEAMTWPDYASLSIWKSSLDPDVRRRLFRGTEAVELRGKDYPILLRWQLDRYKECGE